MTTCEVCYVWRMSWKKQDRNMRDYNDPQNTSTPGRLQKYIQQQHCLPETAASYIAVAPISMETANTHRTVAPCTVDCSVSHSSSTNLGGDCKYAHNSTTQLEKCNISSECFTLPCGS